MRTTVNHVWRPFPTETKPYGQLLRWNTFNYRKTRCFVQKHLQMFISCRSQMGPMLAPWTLLSGNTSLAGSRVIIWSPIISEPIRKNMVKFITWNYQRYWWFNARVHNAREILQSCTISHPYNVINTNQCITKPCIYPMKSTCFRAAESSSLVYIFVSYVI